MALKMYQFIKDTMAKYGTIQECYWDNEIDAVLGADEFLDEERIQEVLNACTQEAWDYVYANRSKYSTRIRQLIEPADYWPDKSRFKMTVREMTDSDMENIGKQREADRRKEFEETIWGDVKDTIPERPMDELDDELDDAWEDLTAAKKRMTDFLSKKSGKYVPPSARKSTVDPLQLEIEEEIADCQKKFDEIEKRIFEADEKYLEVKKNECFQEWMCQLQE